MSPVCHKRWWCPDSMAGIMVVEGLRSSRVKKDVARHPEKGRSEESFHCQQWHTIQAQSERIRGWWRADGKNDCKNKNLIRKVIDICSVRYLIVEQETEASLRRLFWKCGLGFLTYLRNRADVLKGRSTPITKCWAEQSWEQREESGT